jgi:hypothetical protein
MKTSARPIKATPHAIMDYGLVIFLLLAPTLFALPLWAQINCYVLVFGEMIFVALSAHGAAIVRLIPMALHGLLEYPILGAFVLAAWLSGSLNDPTARWVLLGVTAVALLLHFLTDYHSDPALERAAPPGPSGPKPATR